VVLQAEVAQNPFSSSYHTDFKGAIIYDYLKNPCFLLFH